MTERHPILAYADGACSGNPGPAGLGVVLRCGARRKEISAGLGHGTNNLAELAAALVALRAIREPQRPVRLLTDSAYVCGLITRNWKPKANLALVERLRLETRRFPELDVVRVPGHAGVPENERADALARQAVATGRPHWPLARILEGSGPVED